MQFDLVLKGGHLIDPQNGIDAPRDIGITGKVIAAVDADLPNRGCRAGHRRERTLRDAGRSWTSTSTPYATAGPPRYVGWRQQYPARRL